ncbi:MAG: hypothetical protein IPG42_13820 [Betaproteobacteria bacterium]|nr:hypothetical protein [Betaproteobacteria bacterium]
MTHLSTSSWSEALQRLTREAIAQLPVSPDGQLHFKHPDQGYAAASYEDLCQDLLTLRSSHGDHLHQFDSVDALLQAGWAID